MKESITSKTGNAPIKQQGHTSDGRYGSSLTSKVKGSTKSTNNSRG
jgi:hypothetical protein